VNEVGPVHRVRLDVPAEQTFGDAPHVPYWSDGSIVDVDGTATPWKDRPFTFAKDPETGGWAVVSAGEAHAELVRISVDGRTLGDPLPTFPQGLAVGPDGQLTVLTEHNTDVTLHQGDRTLDLGSGFEWTQVYGILPNTDVLFQGTDGSVDVAHLDVGKAGSVPGAAAAVTDAQLGFVAYADDTGSWRMEDESGHTRWTVDWAGVSSFSPNGRYVALTGDPRHRIPGSVDWDSDHATGTIWVRTSADLLPVAAFTAPSDAYFGSWTWDGDDLLATVYSRADGQWSLVRLTPDGFTVGRATGKPGGGEEPAYVFAAQ
jgi:hypothetical protein